jgi:hypothetical protein
MVLPGWGNVVDGIGQHLGCRNGGDHLLEAVGRCMGRDMGGLEYAKERFPMFDRCMDEVPYRYIGLDLLQLSSEISGGRP